MPTMALYTCPHTRYGKIPVHTRIFRVEYRRNVNMPRKKEVAMLVVSGVEKISSRCQEGSVDVSCDSCHWGVESQILCGNMHDAIRAAGNVGALASSVAPVDCIVDRCMQSFHDRIFPFFDSKKSIKQNHVDLKSLVL